MTATLSVPPRKTFSEAAADRRRHQHPLVLESFLKILAGWRRWRHVCPASRWMICGGRVGTI
jgi:hypothetical protein